MRRVYPVAGRLPNGKQGIHPLADILYHDLKVYSARADGLVREIVKLADEKGYRELRDNTTDK